MRPAPLRLREIRRSCSGSRHGARRLRALSKRSTDSLTRPIKLSCRSVWKLFGHDAGRLPAPLATALPTPAELAAAGLIRAVRDVSLDIRAGEIFVIMGLSGSGKSTLVRCLSRLIEPTAGEVIFDGRDLLSASERELIELRRHQMGMVFQHFALLPHLSVLRERRLPAGDPGRRAAEREKRAPEMIELVGLERPREHLSAASFPAASSSASASRARSRSKPELWFLDEPFSALDPLIRREMQNEFLRLQNLLQKTIVFITHDFDEAIRLADRIAIMRDGEIIQVGTAEELIVSPATDYVAEFTRDAPRAKIDVGAAADAARRRRGAAYAGTRAARGEDRRASAPRSSRRGKPFAVDRRRGSRSSARSTPRRRHRARSPASPAKG